MGRTHAEIQGIGMLDFFILVYLFRFAAAFQGPLHKLWSQFWTQEVPHALTSHSSLSKNRT